MPEGWWDLDFEAAAGKKGLAYYREFVGPWIHRRLTGRSSGDGRTAKFPTWTPIAG